ncbi:MAG: polyprenyl synthetase family protein [Allorhizobium sp.]
MIGKIGTDIQDAKCSWLVVQALQRATDEQREVLRVRLRGAAAACALSSRRGCRRRRPTMATRMTPAWPQ